jgi:hypothetical protein
MGHILGGRCDEEPLEVGISFDRHGGGIMGIMGIRRE